MYKATPQVYKSTLESYSQSFFAFWWWWEWYGGGEGGGSDVGDGVALEVCWAVVLVGLLKLNLVGYPMGLVYSPA